jgi:flagellar M-ring protein FliF
MDVLPRITRQLVELFRTMTLGQRVTFVMVPLLMLVGFVWFLTGHHFENFQAVSFGKSFAANELVTAERALNQAGLTNYRRDGGKILVSAAQLNRCNAVLAEFDNVPGDLGSQILKQFESLGPFSTDRQRQEMKDALLLQELRRMIEAVPEVEHARVAVANSGRRLSFGQKPHVTANVTIKSRAGRELSSQLIESVRQAVASMVPDLHASEVTVFDVIRGQAFTGNAKDGAQDNHQVQRLHEFTRQYEQQIQKALSFIPNTNIVVRVDIDCFKSTVLRREVAPEWRNSAPVTSSPVSIRQASFESDSASHVTGFRGISEGSRRPNSGVPQDRNDNPLVEDIPHAVQVSISIPSDYYRDVVASRKRMGETNQLRLDLKSIEDEVATKVERTVTRLIPAGSLQSAVTITTVDRLPDHESKPPLLPVEQFLNFVRRHGVSVGLCLLSLCVVRKMALLTQTRSPLNTGPEPKFIPLLHDDVIQEAAPVKPVGSNSGQTVSLLRDGIRSLADSDPVTTAAVLEKWLSEAS